jgi:hypothetical protein
MAKCNDCWCELYDKNMGNCDQCLKNESEEDKPNIRVLLKERAIRQMELGKKGKSNGQSR